MDIVERLELYGDEARGTAQTLCYEAAEEIVRLRAVLVRLRPVLGAIAIVNERFGMSIDEFVSATDEATGVLDR
jgi:hypothetical protein